MVEFDVKVKGLDRAKKAFKKLANNIKDGRPAWRLFLSWYKKEYVPQIFNTQGKALGPSWPRLSEAYGKRRKRKTATLRLTDKLYDAARGDSNWKEKLEKKSFEFGIEDSIKYAAIHQYGKSGKMPQRQYLYTRDDDLSPRAWAVLIKTIDNYLEGSFK